MAPIVTAPASIPWRSKASSICATRCGSSGPTSPLRMQTRDEIRLVPDALGELETSAEQGLYVYFYDDVLLTPVAAYGIRDDGVGLTVQAFGVLPEPCQPHSSASPCAWGPAAPGSPCAPPLP